VPVLHLDDAFRGVARALMQAIDVLCDQCVKFSAVLERYKSPVAGVGLRRPRRVFEAGLPSGLAHVAIADVVPDVRHLFRCRIGRPQALWPAEVRYSRVRRYACARKNDHFPRSRDPATNDLNGCCAHAAILT
jgi:hypothetical protein